MATARLCLGHLDAARRTLRASSGSEDRGVSHRIASEHDMHLAYGAFFTAYIQAAGGWAERDGRVIRTALRISIDSLYPSCIYSYGLPCFHNRNESIN